MARVLVTRPIPGPGVEMIRAAGHEVEVPGVDEPLDRREMLRLIRGCDGVVTQLAERVDAEVFDAAGPGLRVVSNYAVGFNNIDVAEATRRGITVCNTPGVLTEATADITWALILAVARRVAEGDAMVRRGQWTGWAPSQLLGGDLMGRTLVIVGAGRIGYAVARRGARGWDMPVVYVSREKKPDWERTLGARRMELEEALAVGDVVSLHTPLTEATRYLLDGRRLGMMKRSAYLVNTARGPVVDEAALVVALREGKIAGAGLDVYEREPELAAGLAGCDNAVLLPHLGSATHGTRAAMSDLAARNLLAVLRGDQPPHAVNPDVGGTRKPRD